MRQEHRRSKPAAAVLGRNDVSLDLRLVHRVKQEARLQSFARELNLVQNQHRRALGRRPIQHECHVSQKSPELLWRIAVRRVATDVAEPIRFAIRDDLPVTERVAGNILELRRLKVRLVDESLPAVVCVFLAAADETLVRIVDDNRVMRDRADVVVVPVRRFVAVVGAGIDRQITLVINREAVGVAMAVIM